MRSNSRCTEMTLIIEKLPAKVADPYLVHCLCGSLRVTQSSVDSLVNVVFQIRILTLAKVSMFLPNEIWMLGSEKTSDMSTCYESTFSQGARHVCITLCNYIRNLGKLHQVLTGPNRC
jgi:hypothetical protein